MLILYITTPNYDLNQFKNKNNLKKKRTNNKMKRINNMSKKINPSKIPTLQKSVPKTEETLIQEKINTLLPNDLHNLENPSIYLNLRRKNAVVEKKLMKEFFLHPLFREFKKKVYSELERDKTFKAESDEVLNLNNYKKVWNS